jgi:hypothetical protein
MPLANIADNTMEKQPRCRPLRQKCSLFQARRRWNNSEEQPLRTARSPSLSLDIRRPREGGCQEIGCIAAVRASRRALRVLLSMREASDGIKKIPHPEEAAKQLSRRTHGADPADREFPFTLESGGPGSATPHLSLWIPAFAGMTGHDGCLVPMMNLSLAEASQYTGPLRRFSGR